MARANVPGAIQASKVHRYNPYLHLQAPGVIKAQYDARAGEQLAQGVKGFFDAAAKTIPQYAQWQEFGKPMAELGLENAKLANQKQKLENTTLQLKFAETMSSYKSVFNDMKNADKLPKDMDFTSWLQNETEFANKISDVLLGVKKSDTSTNGVKHQPTSKEEDVVTTVGEDGVTEIKLPKDKTDKTDKTSSDGPTFSLANARTAIADKALFNKNGLQGLQNFYNHVEQKVGNIDKEYNPQEYAIYAALKQNKDNPDWRPKSSFDDKGKAVAVFEYIDDKGEKQSTSVPMGAFSSKENWWTPIQIPETHSNFITKNKEDMPTFWNDFKSNHTISDQGWHEFEQTWDEQATKPSFVRSMSNNLRTISGGKVESLTDADGNGKIDGHDYRLLAEPFINEGRRTVEDLARERGRINAIAVNTQKRLTKDGSGGKTDSIDVNTELQRIDSEILDAAQQNDIKYFQKFLGPNASFVEDENGNIVGVNVPLEVKKGRRGTTQKDNIFRFDNFQDMKAMSRSVFGDRGQKERDTLTRGADEFYKEKQDIADSIEEIQDTTGDDGKTSLGAKESTIKKKHNVKKIFELPIPVGNALVQRQNERGALNSREDLFTYLEIPKPENIDYSLPLDQLPEDIRNMINPYRIYYRGLK